MKKIRKEYLIFVGLIVLIIVIFGISNYKNNKPKYDKSRINISFNEEEQTNEYPSSEVVPSESVSDTEVQDNISTKPVVTETESEEAKETEQIIEQTTESTTEPETAYVGDAFAVNQENIYEVISNILSSSPNSKYFTKDFQFDNSIKNELEIFRVSELENHFDEGYVLGYVETPVDDLIYRFDFTLYGNKLSSLTYSQQ